MSDIIVQNFRFCMSYVCNALKSKKKSCMITWDRYLGPLAADRRSAARLKAAKSLTPPLRAFSSDSEPRLFEGVFPHLDLIDVFSLTWI